MKITKRVDGSYIIEKNNMPYHIPNEGEWAEEWAQLNAYALAHPGEVELESLPLEPTLEELKAMKKTEIWSAGDAIPARLKASFTVTEQESFTDQRLGAEALQAGNTATREAKIVSAIAIKRGIEVSLLVEKILRNVAIADYIGTQVIGEQQRLDDQIKVATTREHLESIQWTLTLEELLASLR